MHRIGDVLDLALTQKFVADVDILLNLVERGPGDQDAAGIGQSFQARRDVDAVAVQIVFIGHHIAKIDADPKRNSAILGSRLIAVRHCPLDLYRASDGIDHARELGEQAIAHGLESAPIVGIDLELKDFGDVRADGGERAFFVFAHHPAIPDHICRQDRRQPALYAFGHRKTFPSRARAKF